jgi:hypothetical protein
MRSKFTLPEIEKLTGIPAQRIAQWKSRQWFTPMQPSHGWYGWKDIVFLVCLQTLQAHGMALPHAQACIPDDFLEFLHNVGETGIPVGPNWLGAIREWRLVVFQEQWPAPHHGVSLNARVVADGAAALEKFKAAGDAILGQVVIVAEIGKPIADTLERIAAFDSEGFEPAAILAQVPTASRSYWQRADATGRADG